MDATRASRRATSRPRARHLSPRSRRPRRRRAAPVLRASRTTAADGDRSGEHGDRAPRAASRRSRVRSTARASISAATSAIARSGTQRRTSCGVGASRSRPRSASRALTAEPTRPRAPTIRIVSIISHAPVPIRDTGQPKCALSAYFSARRVFQVLANSGPLSSMTLYQALSRFSPSRTSMWLRWMPSNVAPSASRAPRAALVRCVGLELDTPTAPARRTHVASAGASLRHSRPVPHASGAARSSRSRPSRARVGARETGSTRRPSRSAVSREGISVPSLCCGERLLDEGAPLVARLRLHNRSASATSAGHAMPARVLPRARHARARAGRGDPRASECSTSARRDSTLGACRSTSTRAWSASRTSMSSSARATRRSRARSAALRKS